MRGFCPDRIGDHPPEINKQSQRTLALILVRAWDPSTHLRKMATNQWVGKAQLLDYRTVSAMLQTQL
jgi:hypothetical protein